MKRRLLALAAVVGLVAIAEPVVAQKSADTLRFPAQYGHSPYPPV